MIYSISHDFVFLHCPRTSGTAITKSLSILVKDAVVDRVGKHAIYNDLPAAIQQLRAFTVQRPFYEVRVSYYRYITRWYAQESDAVLSTRWLLKHAERLASMTLDEYLASDEPPISVNGYVNGCKAVFQYHDAPYRQIARFCRVDESKFMSLMEIFKDERT